MAKLHSAWAVVVACGKSEQISPDIDTAFLNVGNQPILTYSLDAFERCAEIEGIIVVASKERMETVLGMLKLFSYPKLKKIVAGSAQRNASVLAALNQLDDDVSVVVVHEASRPCISAELISETIKAAKRYGSGVAAVKIEETVQVSPKGLTASKPLDAGSAWLIQTPQAFKRDEIQKALNGTRKKKAAAPDESTAYADSFKNIHMVPSTRKNIKILEASDIPLVSTILGM